MIWGTVPTPWGLCSEIGDTRRWQNLMIDVGNGPPLVLIPGMQGRWEWMRPTVDALARHFRVLSFTLAGEWTSGIALEPRLGFDSFIAAGGCVLEEAGVELGHRSAACPTAASSRCRYASLRPNHGAAARARLGAPSRLPAGRALRVLQARAAAALPRLPRRIVAPRVAGNARGVPALADRARFAARQGWRVLRRPCHRRRMCDRMRAARARRLQRRTCATCTRRRWSSPATEDLDRTVPAALTRALPRSHSRRRARRRSSERDTWAPSPGRPSSRASIARVRGASRVSRHGRAPTRGWPV